MRLSNIVIFSQFKDLHLIFGPIANANDITQLMITDFHLDTKTINL